MFNRLGCYGRRRSRRFAFQRMSYFFIAIVSESQAEWTMFFLLSMARSGLIALVTFIPILASVLSFVRHSNTLHLNGY
jgi:hypothetical protein